MHLTVSDKKFTEKMRICIAVLSKNDHAVPVCSVLNTGH